MSRRGTVPTLAGLVVVAFAARWVVGGQDIYRDELSTYWLMTQHHLPEGLSIIEDRMEITPPLSFVAVWATTLLGNDGQLLRLPVLLAGLATVPLLYLLGRATVGRGPGLVAATLFAVAPFAIFYGAEARAYGVLMLLVVVVALATLQAVDTGRRRWWVLYGVATAATAYTHYTAVYVLLTLYAWLLVRHRAARVPATAANAAAALAFLPWALTGLRNDLASPDSKIVEIFVDLSPDAIAAVVGHWAIGHADVGLGLGTLPGAPVLVLAALALGAAVIGVGVGRRRPRRTVGGGAPRADRTVLVALLAASALVGQLVASVIGPKSLSVNSLASSFPFLALTTAALVLGAGPRLRIVCTAALLIAVTAAGAQMLGSTAARPAYGQAAAFVDRAVRPGDVLIDGTGGIFATPGPLTPLDVVLRSRPRIVRLGVPQQRDRQFLPPDPILEPEAVVREAVRQAGARGRIFVVSPAAPASYVDAYLPALRGFGLPPAFEVVGQSRTRTGRTDLLAAVLAREAG